MKKDGIPRILGGLVSHSYIHEQSRKAMEADPVAETARRAAAREEWDKMHQRHVDKAKGND